MDSLTSSPQAPGRAPEVLAEMRARGEGEGEGGEKPSDMMIMKKKDKIIEMVSSSKRIITHTPITHTKEVIQKMKRWRGTELSRACSGCTP